MAQVKRERFFFSKQQKRRCSNRIRQLGYQVEHESVIHPKIIKASKSVSLLSYLPYLARLAARCSGVFISRKV